MRSTISQHKLKDGIKVRLALPGEEDDIERLLDESFRDNPFVKLMFRGSAPAGAIRLLNRDMARNPNTRAWIAIIKNEIVGVMKHVDTPYCTPTFVNRILGMWDAIRALKLKAFSPSFWNDARKHPSWEHRHLMILGVHKNWRRKGVASALLSRFVHEADKDGVASFLETDTEEARDLYSRFGFCTVDEDKLVSISLWYMWRHRTIPPQSDDSSIKDAEEIVDKQTGIGAKVGSLYTVARRTLQSQRRISPHKQTKVKHKKLTRPTRFALNQRRRRSRTRR